MGISELLVSTITDFISAGGYPSIVILMILESMIAPVPSEAVMPFAGFLVYSGKFNFWYAVFFSTMGSIIGSLISYYLGAYGGRLVVEKWGRYLLLNKRHLDMTEKFFAKYGEKTIFISRFIPIVRHFISIPAGVGKMKISKFILYTLAGAGAWNAFLTYVGLRLRDNWSNLERYAKFGDIIIIVAIMVSTCYFIYKKIHRKTAV
ncbi:MAG: DedA family protein [Patescibacteria group bacterium]